MNSQLLNWLLYLCVFAVALWAGYSKYRKDRNSYIKDRDSEIAATDRQRRYVCQSVIERFMTTYGFVTGSPACLRGQAEQMVQDGAGADKLTDFFHECVRQSDCLNFGEDPSKVRYLGVLWPQHLRTQHMYMIGRSGYGKTNFIRHLINQDLLKNNGFAVIAPEYDLIWDQILPFIPDNRIKDVIYFNPADLDCPVVFNPLHKDPDDNADLLVDETFTVLHRVMGECTPRMDEILRNCLQALIERPGSTLLDLEPLLDRGNSSFRNEVVRTTQNSRTRTFFGGIYPQLAKDAHLPILNRLGPILGKEYVRNCLCPPADTTLSPQAVSSRLLNIRRAMDDGRILLFNVSDGVVGTNASQLIGQLIVSTFQTATMSRANVSEKDRVPFHLYLDEFQNFCGTAAKSYEQILSRARKYGLGMVLAHQQTGQIPLELLKEIRGCVSTMLCFQVSPSDASQFVREFTLGSKASDITPELLARLPRGHAMCRMAETVTPLTVPLVGGTRRDDIRNRVIEYSRNTHGIPRRKAEPKQANRNSDGRDPLSNIDPGEVFE